MNKQTFKALRSQFRKIYNSAPIHLLSSNREEFHRQLGEAKEEFHSSCGVSFRFERFHKPTQRQQIVSLKVFRHLDYPFKKIQEPKWN